MQPTIARSRRSVGCVLVGLAANMASVPSIAAPIYTITDLGTLGGGESIACGINAAGQIVGDSEYANGGSYNHAFLYSGTNMVDLGTLGGDTSRAYAINNAGQIVGQAYTASKTGHAFLYSGSTMTDLGTLGGTKSTARAINSAGHAVGSADNASGYTHAFRYDGSTMSDLGAGDATGINDIGQVVGVDNTGHAFLNDGGIVTHLGTLGGSTSVAYAINSSGEVVGWADIVRNGGQHAFLYSGSTMTDLGTLGGLNSYAFGINSAGLIVGQAATVSAVDHAFLYRSSAMIDLNSLIDPLSGWLLYRAAGVNDSGQITGFGVIGSSIHAFRLTPVPEPASVALLAFAGLLLSRRGRRG